MTTVIERELLDYYHNYCELTIWFKKIILHSNATAVITIQDITNEFITERNRILLYVPHDRRRPFKRDLNKLATAYYHKISTWSRKQKITIDMV